LIDSAKRRTVVYAVAFVVNSEGLPHSVMRQGTEKSSYVSYVQDIASESRGTQKA